MPSGANVLIATQAIHKHLTAASFDLIGVLDIDTEFNRPDFRSAQRIFSLLIRFRQAAKDKVVVQTYNPQNYAIKAADKFDFKLFYKEELALRKELGFPPFAHLVAIGLRGVQEAVVFEQARALYEKLAQYKEDAGEVMDPQPDLIPKLRDKYRLIIMVKTNKVDRLLAFIRAQLKGFPKKSVIITVNVDP